MHRVEPTESRAYLFPFNPVSVNDVWSRGRGGRVFKTAWIHDFQAAIKQLAEKIDKARGMEPPTGPFFRCDWFFIYSRDNFLWKNGNVRKRDVTNSVKVAEDALFDYIGINDDKVLQALATKTFLEELPFPLYDFSEDKDALKREAYILVRVHSIPELIRPVQEDVSEIMELQKLIEAA